MTLNGVMALTLCYFTDFVVKQLLRLPQFQNLLLIVYDHINTLTARDVSLLPCSWLANQRTTLRGDQILISSFRDTPSLPPSFPIPSFPSLPFLSHPSVPLLPLSSLPLEVDPLKSS